MRCVLCVCALDVPESTETIIATVCAFPYLRFHDLRRAMATRNILFAIDFCTATQYFFSGSFSASGRSPKILPLPFWPCIVCNELSRTQTKISVAHRNYRLEWLNATAASAAPIRRFAQQPSTAPFLAFAWIRRAWALFVSTNVLRGVSACVCVCHNSMESERIARRRRQFKPLAFCVFDVFRALSEFCCSRIRMASIFSSISFLRPPPSLVLCLCGRFSFVFQCTGRRHGC